MLSRRTRTSVSQILGGDDFDHRIFEKRKIFFQTVLKKEIPI